MDGGRAGRDRERNLFAHSKDGHFLGLSKLVLVMNYGLVSVERKSETDWSSLLISFLFFWNDWSSTLCFSTRSRLALFADKENWFQSLTHPTFHFLILSWHCSLNIDTRRSENSYRGRVASGEHRALWSAAAAMETNGDRTSWIRKSQQSRPVLRPSVLGAGQ